MSHLDIAGSASIHPTVLVHGNVKVGERTVICGPGDINGKNTQVTIGSDCDIASYVTICAADSHARCIGLSDEIERLPIEIGHHVFIGQNAVILGGCVIGSGSVIGAGVVLKNMVIPPHSRVRITPPIIEPDYYTPHNVVIDEGVEKLL